MNAGKHTGFTLIEVTVAVLLLNLCLVGLLPAVTRAASTLERVAPLDRSAVAPRGVVGWGPEAGVGRWLSGPSLVWVSTSSATDGTLGVWVDGWLEDEYVNTGTTEFEIGSTAEWRSCAGAEVVVRGRSDGGPWGPPVRLMVPSPVALVGPNEGGAGIDQEIVAHPRFFRQGPLSLGTAAETVPAEDSPVPITFAPAGGQADVSINDVIQEWRADAPRSLDLYF